MKPKVGDYVKFVRYKHGVFYSGFLIGKHYKVERIEIDSVICINENKIKVSMWNDEYELVRKRGLI